jgi:hypothetical protein
MELLNLKQMKKTNITIILSLIILIIFSSCNKYRDIEGTVDFYLLESYETLDNSCGIDESTVETKNKPFIKYDDLLSYNSKRHYFKISDNAIKSIKNMDLSVFGIAFGIKANNELIYTGYFWPSYSSASCDWIVIDPLMISNNGKLYIKLGYPGEFENNPVIDKRNDESILNIFKRDRKLD